MRSCRSIRLGLLALALVAACSPATRSDTATSSPAVAAMPTSPPEPTVPDNVTLRLRLTTTSDWTEVRLLSGATWVKGERISASEAANSAEVLAGQLALGQPIQRAEAGQAAEMVVEAQFSDWAGDGEVVFEIDRGHVGYTEIEFSRYVEGTWTVVQTLRWDGILLQGRNAIRRGIACADLFGAARPVTASTPQPRQAVPAPSVSGMPQGTDGYPWWNDSVFYEIFVRSFFDSNGDGIGDLNGITQNLDYLNDGDPTTSSDLGVTGIWLMPIHPSPSYHGYSVTDYYAVNPEYGTMQDFENLLTAAHARGIRVIIDLVLNHTSSQHPWFLQAQDPASPYHDWYLWSDDDPGYLGYWGQQVWFPLDGRFFYSTFSGGMPDLNYTNSSVTTEMHNVVRFWLEEVGVDGFRLDAAKHLIEEGRSQAHTAATHAWWEGLRPVYKAVNPQAVTVGELWDTLDVTSEYLQGDEFDLAFEFYLADAMVKAADSGDSAGVNRAIRLSTELLPQLRFAPFLANHDQNRLMTQMGNDLDKTRVAASLLLTAPGVPFLYYGEEIGMQGEKPDEHIRRPMQWSADPSAGFSAGTPWQPLGPGWELANVANEDTDPASLLSHYRALIRARNEHAALRVGDLTVLSSNCRMLYSVLRVSQDEAVLVLVNLDGEPVPNCRLSAGESSLRQGSYMPVTILGEGAFAALSTSPAGGLADYVPLPEVPPYATLILQLQPLAD